MGPDDVGGWVAAAANGDKSAWNALVARFDGLVWAVVRAHRLEAADAEDVYQTTWLRLMEHIGQIRDPGRLAGWLATTARHEALKAWRARQRAAPVSDLDLLGGDVQEDSAETQVLAAEAAAEHASRARRLWSAMNSLSERCQQLLRVLAADPPPSYAEVAAALGMAIGSIGPTRARCLERLRSAMTAAGVSAP